MPSRTGTALVLGVGLGPSVARTLESTLEAVDVLTAGTVEAAMDALHSEPVDCVAGAKDAEGADGVELVETVREEHPHLPVVLVGTDGGGRVAGEVINAGVDGYVSLAADGIDGLAAQVEETIGRHGHTVRPGGLDGIEQAVEHAADAILVTDSAGTIEYVNAAFEELTGYERAEAVGRTPRILKSGEQDEAYYERMWETILDGDVWEEEIVNRAKSGERFIAHQTIAPVTDADGTVHTFVGIQRDVTERRRFESHIEASEAALSQLYDTAFDAGAPIELKLRRALEIGTDHLGHPVGYVTRIEDGTQKILAAVGANDRIEAEATDPMERTYCRETVERDGPLVISDAAAEGWEDDRAFETFGLRCYIGAEIRIDGKTYGTLCFGGEDPRDRPSLEIQQPTVKTLARWVGYEIDRHRYERTLERKTERLEKFASVISHDLRNPLHVASAGLELARETGDDEHLEPVARAHDRMDAIIEDTLTLAREGELVADVSSVSLEAVATDCWDTVATDGAALSIDGDVELRADPGKLRHILENLFRNAVEHGSASPDSQGRQDASERGSTGNRVESGDAAERGESPSVTVTVGPTADGFYVADDGDGIPPDERERVLEQGYSNGDGTGFGLAIVETLAQAHGWSVAVTESRAGGARFEFRADGQDTPGPPGAT